MSDPNPELGEVTTAFVRTPIGRAVSEVHLRVVHNGEPRSVEAKVDRVTDVEVWWRVDVEAHNPVTSYRFLLRDSSGVTTWLNQAGEHRWDVTDASDFRLTTEHRPPDWARRTAWYQIFPDRFSRRSDGRFEAPVPDWGTPRDWTDPVREADPAAATDLWGGSINGIADRLDHLVDLGVTGVYMCPFTPGRSNHRYDAAAFDVVDPLLGGDAALRRLTAEAALRGLRVMGDVTTNHSGDQHPWFVEARSDPSADSRDFYVFDDDGRYESWLGVPRLPKFDLRSAELRRRLLDGPESVAGGYVGDRFGVDGLRIDVANMTGRLGAVDENRRAAKMLRRTIDRVRPDAYLLGEHGHDASGDLDGAGWHGTMNYAGFTRPVWSWLRREVGEVTPFGRIDPVPRRSGTDIVRSARAFQSQIPFSVALSNTNLLGSHDTPRWAYVSGRSEANVVGLAMLCAWPGSPSVFYGDEIGLGPDAATDTGARLPFPWDRTSWDLELLECYRGLLRMRRDSTALAVGGMRWVHVGDDELIWLRESGDEQLLVYVARSSHEPVEIGLRRLGYADAEPIIGQPLSAIAGRLTVRSDGPTFAILRVS